MQVYAFIYSKTHWGSFCCFVILCYGTTDTKWTGLCSSFVENALYQGGGVCMKFNFEFWDKLHKTLFEIIHLNVMSCAVFFLSATSIFEARISKMSKYRNGNCVLFR